MMFVHICRNRENARLSSALNSRRKQKYTGPCAAAGPGFRLVNKRPIPSAFRKSTYHSIDHSLIQLEVYTSTVFSAQHFSRSSITTLFYPGDCPHPPTRLETPPTACDLLALAYCIRLQWTIPCCRFACEDLARSHILCNPV